MCGLAGWITENNHPNDDSQLSRMLTPLVPRGPDDQGTWHDECAALGHQRLRIIDLVGGQQPLVSERSVLVFNGEIYNFEDIKKKFDAFDSNSDSEVLHKALETMGLSALNIIRGMYAFAYYDRIEKSLLLVRDPVGKKPLFFSVVDGTLIFSSTCQSLRQHPAVSSEVSHSALFHYFVGESPKDPHTLYQDIQAVPAGGWIRYQNKKLTRGVHWQWPEEIQPLSPAEEQEKFSALFATAVKRRLKSDVPLGVFLSGGLDSSSVAWQAAQFTDPSKLHTFSIGFEESSYDESAHSLSFAKTLGSQHHSEILSEKNILDILPKALDACDQPLADGSLLPFYLLCQITRQQMTVALSGDGADDVMAGYDPFRALKWATRLHFIPKALTEQLQNYFETLPPQDDNLPWAFKGKQFLRGLKERGGTQAAHWMSAWHPQKVSSLLDQAALTETVWQDTLLTEESDFIDYFRRRYLKDQILVKVDRASMAHSLEVRCPFLDQDLIEFISTLPMSQLYYKNRGKQPLRRWAQGKLPPHILNRPKKGFGMPISQWLRGPLSSWLIDMVNEKTLKDMGLKHQRAIHLRDKHLKKEEDHRKELWTLAVLCHWWKGK